jgi:hypothetical protein
MGGTQREVEINVAGRRRETQELRQYLVTASNELYLYEMECEGQGQPVPAPLKRAHAAIRAEVRRLEAEAEQLDEAATAAPSGA